MLMRNTQRGWFKYVCVTLRHSWNTAKNLFEHFHFVQEVYSKIRALQFTSQQTGEHILR